VQFWARRNHTCIYTKLISIVNCHKRLFSRSRNKKTTRVVSTGGSLHALREERLIQQELGKLGFSNSFSVKHSKAWYASGIKWSASKVWGAVLRFTWFPIDWFLSTVQCFVIHRTGLTSKFTVLCWLVRSFLAWKVKFIFNSKNVHKMLASAKVTWQVSITIRHQTNGNICAACYLIRSLRKGRDWSKVILLYHYQSHSLQFYLLCRSHGPTRHLNSS